MAECELSCDNDFLVLSWPSSRARARFTDVTRGPARALELKAERAGRLDVEWPSSAKRAT